MSKWLILGLIAFALPLLFDAASALVKSLKRKAKTGTMPALSDYETPTEHAP